MPLQPTLVLIFLFSSKCFTMTCSTRVVPSNKLFYYYFQHNQKNISQVLQYFSNMKDFHNQANRLHTLILICDLLAQGTNSTLQFRKFLFGNNSADFQLDHPTVLPFLGTLLALERTPLYLTAKFENRSKPLFAQIDSFQFNIAYCDLPRTETLTVFQAVLVFSNPFDKPTWIGLTICFALVCSVVYISGKLKNYSSLSLAFLITFSALLSPVMGNTSLNEKLKACAPLIALWLFCSLVLINSYAGLMTSVLIQPPTDDVIANLDELVERGYSLVYPLAAWVASDKNLAKKSNISSLAKLLERPIMQTDYIKELVTKEKRAFFSIWQIATGVAFSAKALLENGAGVGNANKEKDCYVGGQVLQTGEMYYGFLPPNNYQTYMAFRWIFDAGIYRRWMTEYSELSHSKRVQDRAKVKSPTQLFQDVERTIKPLSFYGKMVYCVFSILASGILVALMLLFGEISWNKHSQGELCPRRTNRPVVVKIFVETFVYVS